MENLWLPENRNRFLFEVCFKVQWIVGPQRQIVYGVSEA